MVCLPCPPAAWCAVIAIARDSQSRCCHRVRHVDQEGRLRSSPAPTSSVGEFDAAAVIERAGRRSSAAPVPVHVSLLEGDGATYGVGMPIVAYFTQTITDSSAFLKATTVTINGSPTPTAPGTSRPTATRPSR